MANTIEAWEQEVRTALHYFKDVLFDYGDQPPVIILLFKLQWLMETCASCMDHTKLWTAATMELLPDHDFDEPYEGGEFQFCQREISLTEIWLLLRLLMVDRKLIERYQSNMNLDIDEIMIRALRHGLALRPDLGSPHIIDIVYVRDNLIWIWHKLVKEHDPVSAKIQYLIDNTKDTPLPKRLQDWIDLHPACIRRLSLRSEGIKFADLASPMVMD